jgi:two-component system cell cycle sensor histidine kinase/response regulator CckA
MARVYFRVSPVLNQTQTASNELQSIVQLDSCDDFSPAHKTILVVEDEAFVREAACDILEGEGFRVLRACNATEAQTAVRRQQESVQLLLSDVVLPGQNGPALAKDLQGAQPAMKTIFISGYPENIVTRYGLTAAQTSYLPKPFSAESLLAKVRQALEPDDEHIFS